MAGSLKVPDNTIAHDPNTGEVFVYRNNQPMPAKQDQNGRWVSSTSDLIGQSAALNTGEQSALSDARAASKNAIDVLSTLTRFQNTNKIQKTGGLHTVTDFLSSPWDSEVQRLQGLTATIAPSKRQPGSGTTSDRDLALYLKGTPGISKNPETNDAIIEDGRREAIRRQQYADYLDKYARENGTLSGAEQGFRSIIGAGTQESPYSADEAGDRSQIPRGAYYRDPQGNLRRNDNGARGNPVIEPAQRQQAAPRPAAAPAQAGGWSVKRVN